MRKIAFDYLRASAIVLVLLVHAALAYSTSAFFNLENPMASSNPVVDAQRWIAKDSGKTVGRPYLKDSGTPLSF